MRLVGVPGAPDHIPQCHASLNECGGSVGAFDLPYCASRQACRAHDPSLLGTFRPVPVDLPREQTLANHAVDETVRVFEVGKLPG